MNKGFFCRATVAGAAGLVLAIVVGAGPVAAQQPSADQGLRVFKSANCMGCHKWSGAGGGGYGGAAANLRETSLTLDQIEETVRCGRPTTGMPHFEADAYSDGHCYGLKTADLPAGQMPPEPDHTLRAADIKAVAAYVVAFVKGKGEPTFAQCQAFFGSGTRSCDIYAKQDNGGTNHEGAVAQPASASAPDESHPHLKVDAAPDSNVGQK